MVIANDTDVREVKRRHADGIAEAIAALLKTGDLVEAYQTQGLDDSDGVHTVAFGYDCYESPPVVLTELRKLAEDDEELAAALRAALPDDE